MTTSGMRGPARVAFGELPELTRALRALGSTRRGGGEHQSDFFRALLTARRNAQRAATPGERIQAFDVPELTRALDRSIERLLAGWPDERPAARRALRADLGERVAPYTRALRLLGERARAASDAGATDRTGAWHAWTAQLGATFAAADEAWLALRPIADSLGETPAA